ncbi:MAG: aldo/keto reductase, partial [Cyanobacteria bacterium J06627_28]
RQSIPIMAYSPIEQGRMLSNSALISMAQARKVTAAQIAIAWLLHQDNVIVIPKTSNTDHIEENYAALNLKLSQEELSALDQAFPPPKTPIPLQML